MVRAIGDPQFVAGRPGAAVCSRLAGEEDEAASGSGLRPSPPMLDGGERAMRGPRGEPVGDWERLGKVLGNGARRRETPTAPGACVCLEHGLGRVEHRASTGKCVLCERI